MSVKWYEFRSKGLTSNIIKATMTVTLQVTPLRIRVDEQVKEGEI
jgi:hypothetical protein